MQINKIDVSNVVSSNYKAQAPLTPAGKDHKYPQITKLSNIYYMPSNISFGHTLEEHKSWGAVYDPKNNKAYFSLFTYPDAQKVEVKVNKKLYPMKEDPYHPGRGRFVSEKLPIAHNSDYTFVIMQKDGTVSEVKDPYAMRQKNLNGPSTVYDHSSDDDVFTFKKWYKNLDTRRISHSANAHNGLKSTQNARIYELQLDTFTNEGTYKATEKKLKDIKEMGFNSIELLPLDLTNSENWGYDGAHKTAPDERFGTIRQLKQLVDAAHKEGLNVIFDVVLNHQGVDGNSLYNSGPYLRYQKDQYGNVILDINGKPRVASNGFGDTYNVRKDDNQAGYEYVRDYLANICLNWIENYKIDGLRFDMTKFIESDDGNGPDFTLKEIISEINHHYPHVFTIAEDGREMKATTTRLEDWEVAPGDEKRHCDNIKQIEKNKADLNRLGFDSEWAFAYMHELQEMTYEAGSMEKFNEFVWNSQNKVKYFMSHDEQGNHEGTRFIAKLMVPKLRLNSLIDQNNPALNEEARKFSEIKGKDFGSAKWDKTCQRAQLTTEKLALMLQKGELEDYKTTPNMNHEQRLSQYRRLYNDILKDIGLKNPLDENPNTNPSDLITYDTIKTAFDTSFAQDKMDMAQVFGQPGPKMVFQGDEMADLTPFRFFREFSFNPEGDKENRKIEKGYDPYELSLKESKMGNIKYSKDGKEKLAQYKLLTKDLNAINDANPALSNGYIVNTTQHAGASKVHATHIRAKDSDNEIFTISHFSGFDYPRKGAGSYGIVFPEGEWQEILNTDDAKYGGDGTHMNLYNYHSNGHNNTSISLPAHSTLIFKRID